MKRPFKQGLSVHYPVIQYDEADFGKCERRYVNDGGSEDGLSRTIDVRRV